MEVLVRPVARNLWKTAFVDVSVVAAAPWYLKSCSLGVAACACADMMEIDANMARIYSYNGAQLWAESDRLEVH